MMMKLEALPKGFRFRPTDEELISHYLRLKINGCHSAVKVIPEIDVCKWEPWDLPELSVIKSDDPEWFFFCARDRKYPNGHRSNRATEAGYWKATGKDRTIKSRRSSPSGRSMNTHLIGMKKTLVFYKGRAPKGERTNWIMHEYRATEPDLDGTGPGQGDYVLCRLFHKSDERLDNSKYDEVDPTGSSPSTNKSSPDDESSDLLQEAAVLATEFKEPEDVKKRLTHEADCTTPTFLLPIKSSDSDGVDQSKEETTMKVYAPIKETPMSEEVTYNQFDGKVLDALQTQNYTDPGANIGSPFADDFGNDLNGFHFQDGTSEKDVSLSELLEGLQKHGNYLYEESSDQKNFVVSSERNLTGQVDGLEQTPSNICKMSTINTVTDTEMVQEQGETFPGFPAVGPSTDHSLSYFAFEKDDSYVNVTTSSSYKAGAPASGTVIKIRSREPQDRPSKVKSSTQGTTSRRIRLWLEDRPNSVCSEKSEDASSIEFQESQSRIAEVAEEICKTCESEEAESKVSDENEVIDQTCDSGSASLIKHSEQNGCAKTGSSFMLSTTWFARPGYTKVYAVSIYVVIILSVVFVGMWRCPSLHDVQG